MSIRRSAPDSCVPFLPCPVSWLSGFEVLTARTLVARRTRSKRYVSEEGAQREACIIFCQKNVTKTRAAIRHAQYTNVCSELWMESKLGSAVLR